MTCIIDRSVLEQILLHGGDRGDQGHSAGKGGCRGAVAGDVAHGELGEGDVHRVLGLHVALELQQVQPLHRGTGVSLSVSVFVFVFVTVVVAVAVAVGVSFYVSLCVFSVYAMCVSVHLSLSLCASLFLRMVSVCLPVCVCACFCVISHLLWTPVHTSRYMRTHQPEVVVTQGEGQHTTPVQYSRRFSREAFVTFCFFTFYCFEGDFLVLLASLLFAFFTFFLFCPRSCCCVSRVTRSSHMILFAAGLWCIFFFSCCVPLPRARAWVATVRMVTVIPIYRGIAISSR